MPRPSPFVSKAADEYLAAYIDAAQDLGAGWIVVHGGYHFGGDKRAHGRGGGARIGKAAKLAEKAKLLLENLSEPEQAEVHYLAHDIEECRYYFDRLDSPALGWSFTVNHAHIHPNRIDEFMARLDLERCGEVRLADCRGTHHEEHLRPGEGTIDFPAMFAAIERSGYRGHYMQAFRQSRRHADRTRDACSARRERNEEMRWICCWLSCPLTRWNPAVAAPESALAAVAQGDERGMANQIGPATTALHLAHAAAGCKSATVRSNTMPLSPFAGPYAVKPEPSNTIRAARTSSTWRRTTPARNPPSRARRWTRSAAWLLRAVGREERRAGGDRALLRRLHAEGREATRYAAPQAGYRQGAADHHERGCSSMRAATRKAMEAGELVTAADLQGMLKAQGLEKRGVLPGDVVYVRTGWSDHWRDPDAKSSITRKAPGFRTMPRNGSRSGRIVLIGLDTPFVDTVAEGMLAGKGGTRAVHRPACRSQSHHHMLAQAGILIENAEARRDGRRPRLGRLHVDPAFARQGRGRSAVRAAAISMGPVTSWTKISTRPTTETVHTAVRSHGMPR